MPVNPMDNWTRIRTDPDLQELVDDILEYIDTDEGILERVENLVASYWPDLVAGTEPAEDTDEYLDQLVECERMVRLILHAELRRKLILHKKENHGRRSD